jgi:hypothetical protein
MRTIELLKAIALATANNNSLHTTIKEEPQGNSEAQHHQTSPYLNVAFYFAACYFPRVLRNRLVQFHCQFE